MILVKQIANMFGIEIIIILVIDLLSLSIIYLLFSQILRLKHYTIMKFVTIKSFWDTHRIRS